MPRLFVALDLPENIKNRIPALHTPPLDGARWTIPVQWHITLHFIGNADDAPIRQALAHVDTPAFQMSLKGIGTFPRRGRPRVLWVGIDAPSALNTLHTAIGEALSTTGYRLEKRPYEPHMTLARFKDTAPGRDEMREYIRSHRTFSTTPFDINHFTLYESELEPEGAQYSVLERYMLTTTNISST